MSGPTCQNCGREAEYLTLCAECWVRELPGRTEHPYIKLAVLKLAALVTGRANGIGLLLTVERASDQAEAVVAASKWTINDLRRTVVAAIMQFVCFRAQVAVQAQKLSPNEARDLAVEEIEGMVGTALELIEADAPVIGYVRKEPGC